MSHPPLTLRPFQAHGAAFLAIRSHAAVLDWMGLGKTPQAITALKTRGISAGERVLIIAPLATALGWQREVTRWWPDCPAPFTICRRKDKLPTAGLVFIPWTDLAVRRDLIDAPSPAAPAPAHAVVIADECHRIKTGPTVKLSKAFTGSWAKPKGSTAWVREPGIVDRAPTVWALSGTPMPNSRPIELLPLFLALGVVGSDRSCRMKQADYERRFCYNPYTFDLQGRRNIDELAGLLRDSGVVLRRTPADVKGELPPLVRSIVPLSGIKDPVDPALREAAAKLGPGELPPLEEMSAYRRDLGAVKAPIAAAWILELLEDLPAEAALVVFVHHKAVGRSIQAALQASGADRLAGVEFASGEDAPTERQAKVDRFAAPTGPRVFLGTTDACGTGMNGLHLRTTTCVFVECEWSPSALDQAEGRIRRMGGVAAAHAMAYYLAAADCLDSHIIATVDDKRDVIWQALDADEGRRADAPPPPPAPLCPGAAPPAALGVDALPEPSDPSVRWSWAKDKTSGEWLVQNCHHLDTSAQAAWAGAEVTVTSNARQAKVRRLVACVYTGPHNGGWCIWTHADPDSAGAKHRNANARFIARMQRRSRDPVLTLTLDAGGALDDAARRQAGACAAAARHLTGLDADHAALRNDEGWSSADVTVGRIVASVDTAFWTRATLAGAQAILRRYRNTQVPATLGAAIWPEPVS